MILSVMFISVLTLVLTTMIGLAYTQILNMYCMPNHICIFIENYMGQYERLR